VRLTLYNIELNRQVQRIRSLIAITRDASDENIELQSHWAKYLCVLSAGLLENGLKEIYSEYAIRCTPAPIGQFIRSYLSGIQNPKSHKFLDIAKSFRPEWEESLCDYLDNDGRREAINAIMDNRHKIAHGKDSDISIARLSDYLTLALQVLEFIEQQCRDG
jgi:hypothetical protein